MILSKKLLNSSTLPLVFGALSGVSILIGIILVNVIRNSSEPEANTDFQQEPVIEEEIEDSVTIEEVIPEFESNVERLPEFGDYINYTTINTVEQYGNRLPVVPAIFTGAESYEMAAIERLLLSSDTTLQSIYPTYKTFPKNYVGDKFWKFEDDEGNLGAICIKGSYCYLFYYKEEVGVEEVIEDVPIDDPFLSLGLEFSSYGYLQPKQNFFVGNELYADMTMEEADKVLSALFTGEKYTESSQFYLAQDAVYTYGSSLKDFDYTAYRVNKDLEGTFIEVYLYEGKFYNVVTEIEDYEEIVDREVLRRMQEKKDTSEVEDGDDGAISINDFRDGKVAEYVWDGEDRTLWDVVLRTSTKDENGDYLPGNLQQMMQYGFESYGVTLCEFIGETRYVNDYFIKEDSVYAIKIATGDFGSVNYYMSVNEVTRSIVFYPADVTTI